MKRQNIILFILLGLLFLPWLGEVVFNTKGEPREAIVAMSMLDSGDWILPVSYGEDIPYKPPMFAWLIAIFSVVFNGGVVNEFTSRLPSALAAIGMLIAVWHLIKPRLGATRAWAVTLVTATSFEFFRSASACRVDMVLTACMVGAIIALYNLDKHKLNYLWATLLLSGAVLTKGPIGALLPCLAMGLYFLFRGDNFFKALLRLVPVCLASFLLPALWYYGAWLKGGDGFLALAIEENIGRLTGSMSYDSHVNPWWYNITSLLAGMLPWTVPVVIALCYRRVRQTLKKIKLDRGLPLMSWTVALTILVFYCIPESKRSVYLLPCYPFLAYGVVWVIDTVRDTLLMRYTTRVLAVLAVIVPITALILSYTGLGHLRLESVPAWRWPLALIPTMAGLWWLLTRRAEANANAGAILMVFTMMLAYNAAFAPMVLNPKSDRPAAETIAHIVKQDTPVYGIVEGDRLLRYYTINFYLGDRMLRAESINDVPHGAWVIAPTLPDGVKGDTLTVKSCDTRAPIILFQRP